ncbi:hypothetical protein CPB83DRAFT_841479 [Crepidotus variabilis]|uniref:GYF domain-containing protein n=1 Tax=Crepidotus variabilis TaxID=179855 RepID=A0A9P6JW67_9AGAR|nr:hypothetical protein CPB83DRAFT_841479 [Crepidotus variabilis]
MAPRAGQKRSAATQIGEASSSSNHKSKKTRFVEPDEDPEDFAEQVDANLEQSTRKGRVKNEGYESDSTDDGEGVVESRKKGGKDDEDDVDDMFAELDEEKESKDVSGKKKDSKFMRLADIEGQEFRDDDSDSGAAEDDEPEDEDDAERRKKAGMGFELSSFNMRDEMEEGKFTEDGNYIRTKDPNAVHDRWMDGVSEKEMKLARRKKREQEKLQRQKMLEEEKELEESGGKASFEKDLLPFLKKGETIVEALQRLGSQAKKVKNKPKPGVEVDKTTTHVRTDVETITHLASNIMSLGDVDIYNKTYEELVRAVRSAGSVPQDWEPPSADVKYEYKWATPEAGQADQTFGPFGEEEIKSWYNAMYFGSAGEKVKVRKVGGEWGDWDDVIL